MGSHEDGSQRRRVLQGRSCLGRSSSGGLDRHGHWLALPGLCHGLSPLGHHVPNGDRGQSENQMKSGRVVRTGCSGKDFPDQARPLSLHLDGFLPAPPSDPDLPLGVRRAAQA